MKKLITITILAIVAVLFAADVQIVKTDFVAQELEVVAMLEELPVKQAELETKVYSGTIDEIVNQRIADVNAVIAHSEEIKAKAVKLAEDEGLTIGKQEAVFRIIDKNRKVEKEIEMKENNEFLKAAVTIFQDANWPGNDPNDPNYFEEQQRNNEFMEVILEITKPI